MSTETATRRRIYPHVGDEARTSMLRKRRNLIRSARRKYGRYIDVQDSWHGADRYSLQIFWNAPGSVQILGRNKCLVCDVGI